MYLASQSKLRVARINVMSELSHRVIESLTRRRDYLHNLRGLHTKEGHLMRKPTEQQAVNRNVSDYGPCPGCYGFLLKSDLWRHVRKCEHYKVVEQEESQQRGCVQLATYC